VKEDCRFAGLAFAQDTAATTRRELTGLMGRLEMLLPGKAGATAS